MGFRIVSPRSTQAAQEICIIRYDFERRNAKISDFFRLYCRLLDESSRADPPEAPGKLSATRGLSFAQGGGELVQGGYAAELTVVEIDPA